MITSFRTNPTCGNAKIVSYVTKRTDHIMKRIQPQVSSRLFKEPSRPENTTSNKPVTPISKTRKVSVTPIRSPTTTPKGILKRSVTTTPKDIKEVTTEVKEVKMVELPKVDDLAEYKKDVRKILTELLSILPQDSTGVEISEACSLEELNTFKNRMIEAIQNRPHEPVLSMGEIEIVNLSSSRPVLEMENMTLLNISQTRPELGLQNTSSLNIGQTCPELGLESTASLNISHVHTELSLENETLVDVPDQTTIKLYSDLERYTRRFRIWNRVLLLVIIALVAVFFFVLD